MKYLTITPNSDMEIYRIIVNYLFDNFNYKRFPSNILWVEDENQKQIWCKIDFGNEGSKAIKDNIIVNFPYNELDTREEIINNLTRRLNASGAAEKLMNL